MKTIAGYEIIEKMLFANAPSSVVQEAGLGILKFSAMAGFVVAATLFVSLNQKGFDKIFSKKTITYWVLFFGLSLIPLLVIIYFFSIFF